MVHSEYGIGRKEALIPEIHSRFLVYRRAKISPRFARRYQNIAERFTEFLVTKIWLKQGSRLDAGAIELYRKFRLRGLHPPKTKGMIEV